MRLLTRIIIHHSATPVEASYEEIEKGHLERGFTKIGYHWVVLRHGTIRPARPVDEVGAHALGANEDSIGICVVGDNTVEGRHWHLDQVVATQKLIDALRVVFGPLGLFGHRDVRATLCPGVDVKEVFA